MIKMEQNVNACAWTTSQKRTFMLFMDFSRACEQLEGTSGRLDMIDIISRVLPTLSPEELPGLCPVCYGQDFPGLELQKNWVSAPISCMKPSAT